MMLVRWTAEVAAETYVPMAVGAVIGGVGSLVYLLRYQPPAADKELTTAWPQRRRLALRLVSGVYVGVASLFLVAALVAGDRGFVVTGVLLVALALGALLILWGPGQPAEVSSHRRSSWTLGQGARRRPWIWTVYLASAVAAFGLALAVGDVFAIACSGFLLLSAVIGAVVVS